MDEKMNLTDTAADIAIEGAESVDAAEEQETVESATSDSDNVPSGEGANSDEGAEGAESAEDAPEVEEEAFLTTRHNHEVKRFNREEAEDLVQMGLHSKPLVEKMRYLAALMGEESVKPVLDKLISAHENVVRTDISKKVSDPDLVEQLVSSKLSEFKTKAGQQEQAEKDAYNAEGDNINRRLAKEFVDLQKDFPDVASFDALPKAVKRTAADGGVPLKYAYALHLQREQAKIAAADKAAKAAASASAGSAKSDVADGTSPEIAQMMSALWGN